MTTACFFFLFFFLFLHPSLWRLYFCVLILYREWEGTSYQVPGNPYECPKFREFTQSTQTQLIMDQALSFSIVHQVLFRMRIVASVEFIYLPCKQDVDGWGHQHSENLCVLLMDLMTASAFLTGIGFDYHRFLEITQTCSVTWVPLLS